MQDAIAWRWSEDPEQKRWMDWRTDWTHHDKAKDMGFPVEYAVAQSALNEPGKVYYAMLRGEIPKLTWRQMVHLSGPVPNTADEALAEIARLREELKAAKQQQKEDKVLPNVPVYLLERQENGLSWYIGAATGRGNAWHWTADVNSAIRFSRKEDAAACWSILIRNHVGAGGFGTTETAPTQHLFEDTAAL